MKKILSVTRLVLACALTAAGLCGIDRDQLKMLQDPGGWEYIKMSGSGLQTDHVCFDGQPHPDVCRGRLTLTTGKTFTQEVTISGETVSRHGTYELDGDQLAFFDEFGTRDGPYTIEIDSLQKTLVMHMPQVRVELLLEKAIREKKLKGTK